MRCPHCNLDNSIGARFCNGCGAKLETRCDACGQMNPLENRFCHGCGQPLGVGAPARTLAAYTPRYLVEEILTSRSAFEGERKQVTVLFCDVVGSTGLAERLGAEPMHRLLSRFFDLALAEVHRYEGTINQFLGDGFMALFGAPIAHEDHARRAALAALGLRRVVRERLADLGLPQGESLAVRMGLNSGLVVVGAIGDNLRMDYTAIGDTTNLAARLQQLAEPDTICLSEATYRSVESYFECETFGERKLKGKTLPVAVYRLVGARGRSEPGRATIRSMTSPLVGRDTEVMQLTVCLERLLSGHVGIVSILGEAGLGKSRLVTEVRRTLADEAVLWLEGRALSFGQTLSYWPFLEILRSWLGITEEDSEAVGQDKLEHQVRALFPADPADILPYLATLLQLPVPPEYAHRVKYLDGQAMGRQVFRSIRRLFERLARQRPVVLVFEDLHWTDQSSVELIEHLFPLVETVPLLLWWSGRLEGESPAIRLRDIARTRYERRYTEVVVVPLAPTASAALVDNLLAARQVPVRLKELILQRTEGNPFFVEEVIRALVAAGTLAWDERAAQWRVTREVDQVTIPDTVQDVIMARIDRLDENVKQLLKIASVIGRSFFYRVLRAIAEAVPALDRDLDRLQHLELIREKRRTPELEYVFKHALVQEAAYESVLVEHRRQLHSQVGQCIERLFADGLEQFYGVLAYHYARAEDWQKAQEYLFRAGDQSGQVAADAEALAHYREAIRAYERAFGDRWDSVQRASLDRKIGEALFRRGAHEQAYEHLARAVASLTAPYPRSRWGIRRAIVREVVRQLGHRLLPGLFIPKRGEEADPVGDELWRLQTMMGWIDYFTNQERFLLVSLTALNLFERRRYAGALALQYMGAGLVCDVIPAFSVAAYYHRRAVAHAEETAHPVAVGHAYLGMALHEDALGQWQCALDHYRTAAVAFREAGHLRGWGQATVQIGWSYAFRGDFLRAIDHAQEVIRLGQDASDRPIWAWGLIVRGWIKRCTGALDEALSDLEAAIDLSQRIPDYAGIARASGLLGGCHLCQGRVDRALPVLKEANVIISERGLRGREVAFVPLFLAEALLRAADEAEGAERAGMLKSAKRACREAMRQGKRVRPYFPMAARVRGMWQWRVGKPGAAERSWRSSIAVAEELEAPYLLALTSLEIGQCLGRPAELTRAAVITARIGASLERDEARQLLAQGTER